MSELTIPGLLMGAVVSEAGVIAKLYADLKAERAARAQDRIQFDADMKEVQKGRLRDRDQANQVFLRLLAKSSGVNLSDYEAKFQAETTG